MMKKIYIFIAAAAMLGSSQLAPQQQQQQLYGAAAFQMEQGRGAYSQFPGHYAGNILTNANLLEAM